MVSFAQVAFNPAGNPVTEPIPVAPMVVCKTGVSKTFTHCSVVNDAELTELTNVTVIFPVAFTLPQPPINGIV